MDRSLSTEQARTALPSFDRTGTLGRLASSLISDLSKENDPQKVLSRLDRINPALVEYINSDNDFHQKVLDKLNSIQVQCVGEALSKVNKWLNKFHTTESHDPTEEERIYICNVANVCMRVPYEETKVKLLDNLIEKNNNPNIKEELKEILTNAIAVASRIGYDDIASEIMSIMERHNLN